MKNLTTTTRGSGRSAFTLVELLLVILIIAVLASLGVGVMAQAQNDAAQSATRSRISLIERILETELEDYEVKRSPVPLRVLAGLVTDTASSYTDKTQALLHVKNLKRIIIVDLIRAEMPDGSQESLGTFPTDTVEAYLSKVGITMFPTVNLGSVNRWAGTQIPADGIDGAADRSEILYQVLLGIDLDGVPAVEQIGSQSIGDSDGDGNLEVVDAWGDPIFLQWQQENLDDNDDVLADVWGAPTVDTEAFVGLSKESSAAGFTDLHEYAKPVLPAQIRPFLTSERLIEIDGVPADYDENHRF